MKRINEIVKYIYPYENIADVGCDHGYLIIEAFKKYPNHFNEVLAIDNKKGPLEQAKTNISKFDYYNQVTFILSNGIDSITQNTQCVCIAGMGGLLICDILESDFLNSCRFIIQANRDITNVRIKMVNKGFFIKDEVIIEENKKFYEIIVFDKGTDKVQYTTFEYEYGPILLRKRDSLFLKKWKKEIDKLKKIKNKDNEEIINKKIERINEILCM